MSERIFEFEIPKLLKIQISGRNEGRVDRYLTRIGREADDEGAKVAYTASIAGNWHLDSKTDKDEPGERVNALPVFFESRYFVRCDFDSAAKVTGCRMIHPMAAVADQFDFSNGTLVGTLDFVNSPGKFEFRIDFLSEGRPRKLVLTWIVASEKLDVVRDYNAIKRKIEENAPGLVQAFLSKTQGCAGYADGAPGSEAVWYAIFQQVVDEYLGACAWIIRRPHLKYCNEVEYLRASRIKRWTPALVNRYCELPDERKSVAVFRSERIVPEVDTTENRFVLYTLREIAKRLGAFADDCDDHPSVSRDFVGKLREYVSRLERKARHPFFSPVGRFAGFRQESLAIQRKRGYATIYATWRNLKRSLDATKEGMAVGHRPISALYEFWCFLVMRDILAETYGQPSLTTGEIKSLGDVFEEADAPFDETRHLAKMEYVFEDKDGLRKLRLTYQQSYGKADSEHLSYINEQRPDIVLTLEGEEKFTYLFDAKYRVNSFGENGEIDATPSETINDMHRYRDAILYRQQEGNKKLSRQVIGAYVLYPGRQPPKSVNYQTNIDLENIGAIPLLPGEDGLVALKTFLSKILGRKTAAAHLGDDRVIPTRGTSVVVGEAFGEGDVLEVPVIVPDWDAKVRADMLEIPLDQLKGRDPRLIKYVRFIAPNKPKLMAKVEFHSMPTPPATGNVVYEVMTSTPKA